MTSPTHKYKILDFLAIRDIYGLWLLAETRNKDRRYYHNVDVKDQSQSIFAELPYSKGYRPTYIFKSLFYPDKVLAFGLEDEFIQEIDNWFPVIRETNLESDHPILFRSYWPKRHHPIDEDEKDTLAERLNLDFIDEPINSRYKTAVRCRRCGRVRGTTVHTLRRLKNGCAACAPGLHPPIPSIEDWSQFGLRMVAPYSVRKSERKLFYIGQQKIGFNWYELQALHARFSGNTENETTRYIRHYSLEDLRKVLND